MLTVLTVAWHLAVAGSFGCLAAGLWAFSALSVRHVPATTPWTPPNLARHRGAR